MVEDEFDIYLSEINIAWGNSGRTKIQARIT